MKVTCPVVVFFGVSGGRGERNSVAMITISAYSHEGQRNSVAMIIISAYSHEGQLGNSFENLLRQRNAEVILRI